MRWPVLLPPVLVLAAAAFIQWNALRMPFLTDDYLFLDQVRFRTLPAVLFGPDPLGNYVRPLGRQLWFWMLSRLGGETPLPFHVANLVLFLGALALLFALARRLAGVRAATIATAIVALHVAADVPLRWASGSQDLLALDGALACLVLFVSGRRTAAALALFAALLAKETVALAAVIAALAARRDGEAWRVTAARAWPLGVATLAWAALWLAVAGRHAAAAGGHPDALAVVAALVHLGQATLGAEWSLVDRGVPRVLPALLPLALAAAAVLVAARGGHGARSPRDVAWLGVAWAIAAALPVATVVGTWSAYYYLFAVCGAALAIGVLLARAPAWAAVLAVALLAWGSEAGRRLEEFSTTPAPWTLQSHVNRFYLERVATIGGRLLDQIRAQRPTLAPRTTVFFSGLPTFAGLQTADGPVLRWAYRDSSLRSYWLSSFSIDKAARGAVVLFDTRNGGLEEWRGPGDALQRIASANLVSDNVAPARDALLLRLRQGEDPGTHYWLAWIEWDRGDRPAALVHLAAIGFGADSSAGPALAAARTAAAAGDTARTKEILGEVIPRHALDADAHAYLADLFLEETPPDGRIGIEAYAARVLAPRDPDSWRRWARAQMLVRRYLQAARSLDRYFALAGPAGSADAEAVAWRKTLARALPGGDLAQQALRNSARP